MYFASLLVGVVSTLGFFILLIPLAVMQLGNGATSATDNFITFALLVGVLGVAGFIFIANNITGAHTVRVSPKTVMLQVLLSLFLFSVSFLFGRLLLSTWTHDSYYEYSQWETRRNQIVAWSSVLIPGLAQHLVFWRIALRSKTDLSR